MSGQCTKAAREAGLEGTVGLSIVVNQEGIPENISVVKPLGLGLDENAQEGVRQWLFNPGTKDGKPVKVRAKVEVSFRLLKEPQWRVRIIVSAGEGAPPLG